MMLKSEAFPFAWAEYYFLLMMAAILLLCSPIDKEGIKHGEDV